MKLTRKAFRAYLEQMDPTDIAGRRSEQGTCPLAQYIDTTEPDIVDLEVREETILYGTYSDRGTDYHDQPTTKWQQRFIRAIDARMVPTDANDYDARVDAVGRNEATHVVTAREALAALEVK